MNETFRIYAKFGDSSKEEILCDFYQRIFAENYFSTLESRIKNFRTNIVYLENGNWLPPPKARIRMEIIE